MSEMVERVARACYRNAWPELREDQLNFDGLPSARREQYMNMARAVMKILGNEDEITDDMLEAGRVALHAPENHHGAVLGAVFCAMIDAALNA